MAADIIPITTSLPNTMYHYVTRLRDFSNNPHYFPTAAKNRISSITHTLKESQVFFEWCSAFFFVSLWNRLPQWAQVPIFQTNNGVLVLSDSMSMPSQWFHCFFFFVLYSRAYFSICEMYFSKTSSHQIIWIWGSVSRRTFIFP